MDVSQAKNLLNTLERSNKHGFYLTDYGNHRYTVISGNNAKTLKKLNTAKIALAVEECFEALKCDKISEKHRVELMTSLKTQIKNYNARVYTSKTWYQKIGSWFGCVSTAEKKINNISKLAEVERKTSEGAVNAFQSLEDQFGKITSGKLATDFNQQRKIYMRTFGGIVNNDVKNDTLDGAVHSNGIKSYIDDLETYKKELKNKPDTLSDVNAIISKLKKAYSIAINHELIRSGQITSENQVKLLREIKLRLNEDIQDLKKNGKAGDQILIPGGYQKIINQIGDTTGHAILYQIQKVNDTECTFTIINTGDGAKASNSRQALQNDMLNEVSTIVGETKDMFLSVFTTKKTNKKSAHVNYKTERTRVKDIQYKNVKFENLNFELFDKIFKSKFTSEVESPMEIVKRNINTELTRDKNVVISSAREHSSQELGNCVYKSISSWMKPQFRNKRDYNDFKVKTTEWDLANLSKIHAKQKSDADHSDYKHQANRDREFEVKRQKIEQLDVMLTEGQRVLERRRIRASK